MSKPKKGMTANASTFSAPTHDDYSHVLFKITAYASTAANLPAAAAVQCGIVDVANQMRNLLALVHRCRPSGLRAETI
jgi:hypothetical protein